MPGAIIETTTSRSPQDLYGISGSGESLQHWGTQCPHEPKAMHRTTAACRYGEEETLMAAHDRMITPKAGCGHRRTASVARLRRSTVSADVCVQQPQNTGWGYRNHDCQPTPS